MPSSAAADPCSELWIALLAHAAASNDIKLSCKLLQLSKAFAAAARSQLAGQLQVQLKISSPLAGQRLAAWLQHNACMLQTLQVSLTGTVAPKFSLAGEPACRTLAAAIASAQLAGLRSFAARNIIYSGAETLLCGLAGFAGQLTRLELRMQHCMPPSSKAVEVLAGMGQLRELVLHQPNSMADLDFFFSTLTVVLSYSRRGSAASVKPWRS